MRKSNRVIMQAVIIAAGESKRFWPLSNEKKNKAEIRLVGKPLIYWTIKGLAENGIEDVVVVRRPHSEIQKVLEAENDLNVKLSFAVQEKPLGTGNALWQARELIDDDFFVVWPNKVNAKKLAQAMMERREEAKADAVMAVAPTENAHDYGIVREENGKVVGIEKKPSGESGLRMGGMLFLQKDFFSFYEKLPQNHAEDFIDAVNAYAKEKNISVLVAQDELPTLKYPWQMFPLMDMMFASEYFAEGKGKNVEIGKNVQISGPVYIGDNTKIQANTAIEGPAYIGDNCVIGHSNVLRGPLNIERSVVTGAFMEIKHSIVQQGTHFHSGYLGDSLVGEECRFGAGFISANRRFDRAQIKVKVGEEKIETGLDALGVVAGDQSAFGIQSGTMPGVLVARNSVIKPGVQVFENQDKRD